MQISATHAVDTFENAKEENELSGLRNGQVVELPADAEVWMTGDLHDHRRNFDKLVKAADLRSNPHRHLVLHELIHGDHFDAAGAEDSWITLYKAADLKCDFPQQVHFMLANHDLAQIHGEGIMKSGLSVCEAFTAGVNRDFGVDGSGVNVAITEFLLSLPLAIRCPNGLFFCHSLPADKHMEGFDFSIFNRALTGPDYTRKTGPVYQLIWGRGTTPAMVDQFRAAVGAELLITGHQPQEMGYLANGDRHLIVASDHNQGVFLPLQTSEAYDMERLLGSMRKFVEVEL